MLEFSAYKQIDTKTIQYLYKPTILMLSSILLQLLKLIPDKDYIQYKYQAINLHHGHFYDKNNNPVSPDFGYGHCDDKKLLNK